LDQRSEVTLAGVFIHRHLCTSSPSATAKKNYENTRTVNAVGCMAWLDANMKNIKDEISLAGKLETISMMELRQQPGEVLKSVELGKTFVVERNGKAIAVLSQLPGQNLTLVIGRRGERSYSI
jgi:hypothetical protein